MPTPTDGYSATTFEYFIQMSIAPQFTFQWTFDVQSAYGHTAAQIDEYTSIADAGAYAMADALQALYPAATVTIQRIWGGTLDESLPYPKP